MCRWRRLTNFVKFQNEQGYFMGPSHWQVHGRSNRQLSCHDMQPKAQSPSMQGTALRLVLQPHVDNTPGVLMHEEASQLNPRISVRQHGPFRVGVTLQLVPRPVESGVLASGAVPGDACCAFLQMHTRLMQLRQAPRSCDDE